MEQTIIFLCHSASAQVQGFELEWSFADANGGNLRYAELSCEGQNVYLVNRSLKNKFNINQSGSPISPNSVTVGTYYFWVNGVVRATVSAANWDYNEIWAVPMGIVNNPNAVENSEVSYANNSGNVPGSATGSFQGWNYEGGRLTVSAKPAVSITASSVSACPGESVSLTATGSNSWQWSNGSTANPIVVSPSSTTTYTVTGTSNSGCSSSASVSVNVVDQTIPFDAEYNLCGSLSPNLCPAGGNVNTQWFWSSGGGLQVHVGACYSPSQQGTYTVINNVVSSSGATCQSTGSFIVNQLSGQLNPNFDISTSSFGTYYSIKVSAIQTMFPPDVPNIGYWWGVEDLTTGCIWNNYNRWWSNWYPAIANGFTNNFPEYGESNCSKPYIPYSNHGRFQYGHRYRIKRGLWSSCDDWSEAITEIKMLMTP